METNFNIGKVNVLETEEEQTTENNTPESKKNNSNDDFKKKIIFLGGIILGGIILLLIVLWILSLFNGKNYSYDKIEQIMKDSAINYFADHKKNLPKDKEVVEITASTLASYEYMKDMSEYTEEKCTGKVTVKKSGADYSYTPYLSCGDDYTTKNLYQEITKDTVTQGAGLYKVGTDYVYRGEQVNNYVELDKAVWRIVKVTNNKIVLILNSKYNMSYPWDDRYNSQAGYNTGINDYNASRVKEYLQLIYKDSSDNGILSKEDKTKLSKFDLCIGKRSADSSVKDNSIECSTIASNQKIGLLTVSDYINASIDVNCTTSTNEACQNYNYLVADFNWALATAVEGTTNHVFYVDKSGVIDEKSTSSYSFIRPVIYLDDAVLFESGKGTEAKPYKIK